MKVMYFAPHPDDDVIGCGGSIAKQIKRGDSVEVVYLTSGDAGSLVYSKPELAMIRKGEAKAAANSLGLSADNLTFLEEQDGYLEYNPKNLVSLVDLIRDKKPDAAYIPHENDAHTDHRVTNQLALEAIGRAAAPCFQECKGRPWSTGKILAYEIWTPRQSVSYVEDITDFMELKLKAIRKHESQIKNYPFDDAIEGLNRYRGVMTGRGKYGECFQVLKIDKIF